MISSGPQAEEEASLCAGGASLCTREAGGPRRLLWSGAFLETLTMTDILSSPDMMLKFETHETQENHDLSLEHFREQYLSLQGLGGIR